MDELLEKHLRLVLEANKQTNITSISSWEEGMLLHVRDSLVGLPEIETAPEGRYVDLGSGAGYPGIPLAIKTGRETLLVDSVRKKAALLDSFIEELGLTRVSTYAGRIEVLGREHKGEFSVATARALSKLSVLMELASPLLEKNGLLICYKAKMSDEELEHALSLQTKLGMEFVANREVDLEGNQRGIVAFRKTAEPSIKLPRKSGFAQKKPL